MIPKDVGFGGVDWINVARQRVQWRSHMNMVMNLALFITWEIESVYQLLAPQKGLWPVELQIYTQAEVYTYF